MITSEEPASADAYNLLVGEEREVRTSISCIGFSKEFQREIISSYSLMKYEDNMMVKESDVSDLSDSFQKRPTKIFLAQCKIKKLKDFLCWVKEFFRTYI